MLLELLQLYVNLQTIQLPTPVVVNATCYTSTVAETDDEPFITASGWKLQEGQKIIANNHLPFGTRAFLLGEVYQVQDRGNARHPQDWIDVWWGVDREGCLQFGRRQLLMFIIK